MKKNINSEENNKEPLERKKLINRISEYINKITFFKHKNFKIIFIAVALVLSFGFGMIVEYTVFKHTYFKNKDVKQLDSELVKFVDTYDYVINNYYEDVDKSKLIDNAISGMIGSLDDEYSSFLNGTENTNLNIYLTGSFEGIGVVMNTSTENNQTSIASIFKESPAEKAGLKIGDIILKIDNEDVTTKSNQEITDIFKNKTGVIMITIDRDNNKLTFALEKGTVEIQSVNSKIINDDIGYISVNIFALNTYQQFKDQLDQLESENIKGLIIDLRDNSGGHLTSVEKMISLFLDSSHVIYQTDTKGNIEKFYSTGNATKNYPIVLISNNGSASASEVMIGALKEEYGAIQVGTTTYGKGTVQQLNKLSEDEQYKITIKKWLTPNGSWVNKVGISPDYDVELAETYFSNPSDENDNQLQTAISKITDMMSSR